MTFPRLLFGITAAGLLAALLPSSADPVRNRHVSRLGRLAVRHADRPRVCLLWNCETAPPPGTRDRQLVLVAPNIAPAPILLFPNAPPRTRDAAETLAAYLEKISGKRPEIVEGTPEPLPPRTIWVGVQPVLELLFPALDFTFQHPEEILIAATSDHLVIAGRDRWDPDHMEGWGRLAPITGRQQEYGTANAVYTFLQNQLDVRWLWPGPLGEDVPRRKRVALAPFTYRYHPQIRSRRGLFCRLALGYSKEGPEQVWARRQRLQLDSLELPGGHGFRDWWDRYHETHPEYFALQPDGTRSGFPGPRYAKLCVSNPAVWQQFVKDVEQTLAENPHQRVFNATPNDGWPSGHCVCQKCRAWDHPAGEVMTYHWKAIREDRPAPTDRYVTFANILARLLKKRFPEKDLFVQLHAYGLWLPPPAAAVPDANVLVPVVASFHMRGDGLRDYRSRHRAYYAEWADRAANVAWRPNLGNPAGLSWGMLDIATEQAAEDFRFVADRGCIGLFFDRFWGHYATQGPHYYLLARLAWNPNLDAETVMQDYYARGFGPAAREVERYWRLVERTRTDLVQKMPNRHRAFLLPQWYTETWFTRAEDILDRAAAKLPEPAGVYGERLAFVRAGLKYARLLVDTRRHMQRLEATGDADSAAAARVRAAWKTAAAMKDSFPPFAVNFQPVFRKPDAKRMMGLHPGNPLRGRVRREAPDQPAKTP